MVHCIGSADIKKRLYELGADLSGIACVDCFKEAPEGFSPQDVLPDCKSVIVFAKSFLARTVACNTTVVVRFARIIWDV